MGNGITLPFLKEPIFRDGLGIGFVGLVLNIPLTIIGIKILGPRFGIKTIVGFILSAILIFKSRATSGGSDIIAMIIAKYTNMSLGMLLIIVDSIIVLVGLLVFKDWKIPLYSWIVIYITGKVIDATLQGVSYDKALFIISDKYEEIRNKLINDLNRGGTLINGVGMFKGVEKKIIFTNVNRREQAILRDFIKNIDPNAFMTVIDAHEVLGNGFKSIHED